MAAELLRTPQLRQRIIQGVRPTGCTLGSGAYGSVQEVKVSGRSGVYAAKTIHDTLFQGGGVTPEKFEKECDLVSRLCHPRLVSFLGVCSFPNSSQIALVMEKLHTNLHEFLETANKDEIIFAHKWSIMNDVASGLAFLHGQRPNAVIHRDLSAKNVLLDTSLRAKITDLGNARFLPVSIHQVAAMTGTPGTLVYMPPEVLNMDKNSKAYYSSAIDIFSFGVLSIFILTQTFPMDILPPTYNHNDKLMGRTELERRSEYMRKIHHKHSKTSHVVKLIEQCLDNTFKKRPRIEEVISFLNYEMCQQFEASFVLSGVGNAIGFKNSAWEVCRSGVQIHEEALALGGVENIKIESTQWPVNVDTLLTIAIAESLISNWKGMPDLYQALAGHIKECIDSMTVLSPGEASKNSAKLLESQKQEGHIIPFNPRGGGCGAAMRAAPIGLYYWRPEQIDCLLEVAIESGRMTHNHPTGYLGSLATALFVSYAVQKKPLREWGAGLMQTLPMAKKFIKSRGRDVKENLQNWDYFEDHWRDYLEKRRLLNGTSTPQFDYDCSSVVARDVYYKKLSFNGIGGSSGHDAPMIAYEALLCSWKATDPNDIKEKARQWIKLCECSMLHGGDSDSTGIIAAACWGAMEGFNGVPENHYCHLQHSEKLKKLAQDLYNKTTTDRN